nr:AMP-binding protein [Streptomyces coelicoflavus]
MTDAAKRYPQRPALCVEGTVLTVLELDELSAHVAGGLLAHGVRPGDRVEVRLPGLLVFPVLYFGALRAGAVVVTTVAPTSRPSAARPRGAARGARLMFAPPEALLVADEGASDTTVVRVGPDFLTQLRFWPQHSGVVHRDDDHVAILVDTGGQGHPTQHHVLTHGAARTDAAAAAHAGATTDSARDVSQSVPHFCAPRELPAPDTVARAVVSLFMPPRHPVCGLAPSLSRPS